jgi:hypothetical protein
MNTTDLAQPRPEEAVTNFQPGTIPRMALAANGLSLFEHKRQIYICRAPTSATAGDLRAGWKLARMSRLLAA